ncbi:sugar phosphate isomerase/epimerase family protein [Schumannella luteola]
MSAPGRFSLNQATIKYASLTEAVDATVAAGIPSIGLWREPVAEFGLAASAAYVRDAGLRVSSLCRGGFLTGDHAAALDENRRAIEETAALGAPALVLVVGGLPAGSRDLVGARERVRDALGELTADARAAGIQLAIEPLHPMYVADRAVVSTLGQALDIAEQFDARDVGVVVDTFHVFWDPDVLPQIARAGASGRIASYQVCDWNLPIATDALLSRGYPGDGFIDFESLTRAVAAAGYEGDVECEIFRQDIWDAPYGEVVGTSLARYRELVEPYLS